MAGSRSEDLWSHPVHSYMTAGRLAETSWLLTPCGGLQKLNVLVQWERSFTSRKSGLGRLRPGNAGPPAPHLPEFRKSPPPPRHGTLGCPWGPNASPRSYQVMCLGIPLAQCPCLGLHSGRQMPVFWWPQVRAAPGPIAVCAAGPGPVRPRSKGSRGLISHSFKEPRS